jgi:hypothetical protein
VSCLAAAVLVAAAAGVARGAETAAGAHAAAGAPGLAAAEAALAPLRLAATALDRYSYVLHKSEWKSGRQLPPETMAATVRARPHEVTLRWTGGRKDGQVVTWAAEREQGRLVATPAGWGGVLSVRLDPRGARAMRESRHPVCDTGVEAIVSVFAGTLDRMRQRGRDLAFTDLGDQQVLGQRSRCVGLDLPKDDDPALYARSAEICLADTTHLPTRIRAWDVEDGALRLVEDYGYEQWRIVASSETPGGGRAHPDR